jgi:hypothetical protein
VPRHEGSLNDRSREFGPLGYSETGRRVVP